MACAASARKIGWFQPPCSFTVATRLHKRSPRLNTNPPLLPAPAGLRAPCNNSQAIAMSQQQAAPPSTSEPAAAAAATLAPPPTAQSSGGGQASGCPPHVLEAIYGKQSKVEKKEALDKSLQRWWTGVSARGIAFEGPPSAWVPLTLTPLIPPNCCRVCRQKK